MCAPMRATQRCYVLPCVLRAVAHGRRAEWCSADRDGVRRSDLMWPTRSEMTASGTVAAPSSEKILASRTVAPNWRSMHRRKQFGLSFPFGEESKDTWRNVLYRVDYWDLLHVWEVGSHVSSHCLPCLRMLDVIFPFNSSRSIHILSTCTRVLPRHPVSGLTRPQARAAAAQSRASRGRMRTAWRTGVATTATTTKTKTRPSSNNKICERKREQSCHAVAATAAAQHLKTRRRRRRRRRRSGKTTPRRGRLQQQYQVQQRRSLPPMAAFSQHFKQAISKKNSSGSLEIPENAAHFVGNSQHQCLAQVHGSSEEGTATEVRKDSPPQPQEA